MIGRPLATALTGAHPCVPRTEDETPTLLGGARAGSWCSWHMLWQSQPRLNNAQSFKPTNELPGVFLGGDQSSVRGRVRSALSLVEASGNLLSTPC